MTPMTDEQKARIVEWYQDSTRNKNCRYCDGGYRQLTPIGITQIGSLRVAVFTCGICGFITQFSADSLGV